MPVTAKLQLCVFFKDFEPSHRAFLEAGASPTIVFPRWTLGTRIHHTKKRRRRACSALPTPFSVLRNMKKAGYKVSACLCIQSVGNHKKSQDSFFRHSGEGRNPVISVIFINSGYRFSPERRLVAKLLESPALSSHG
jgi:hypothetical protein